LINADDFVAAVRRLPNKLSKVDPISVNLLKPVVSELGSNLTELFNRSVVVGHLPD